ncbi:bifunctional GNAT family N-acetyltransferase/hotdog fold thioesterase [Algicola sagamiensis]|uniref:bifunctional GNAT family N-acetyltransferase/hotdog fold thioesterase n=1 Tax=Algicola sagamiensis TaxID=163869 RepID=UPI0003A0C60D|nr:bifunctional GNAT family N-acetyltransferase/hotdog fold thioesterase [Algicola sagamiensis]
MMDEKIIAGISYSIVTPATEEEFAQYYHFRWEQFRKPWGKPLGSECDEYDAVSHHVMIRDNIGQVVAIGRLHHNSIEEGQLCFMAVSRNSRYQGVGTLLIRRLEEIAKEQSVQHLVINARDSSIPFYKRFGYEEIGEAPTLFGQLKHQQMRKTLTETARIRFQPKWCTELENAWYETIPLSKAMGIRVKQYTGDEFQTCAAFPPNINLHGSMFAGSIYSLATLTGWGMIHLQLRALDLGGEIVLVDANIRYKQPIQSKPNARVQWSPDLQNQLEKLKGKQKTLLKLQVQILDEEKVCAQFVGTYAVIKP